jgi:hypothetical protein
MRGAAGVSREDARKAMCPRCGAWPGDPCQGERKPRKSNHIERAQAWIGLQDRSDSAWS